MKAQPRPNLVTRWINRLKADTDQQITRAYHDGDGRYCALGVLYAETGQDFTHGEGRDARRAVLSEWSCRRLGDFRRHLRDFHNDIVGLNEDISGEVRYTFPEIAERIPDLLRENGLGHIADTIGQSESAQTETVDENAR